MSKKNRAKSKAKRFGEGLGQADCLGRDLRRGRQCVCTGYRRPSLDGALQQARAAGGRRLQRDPLHAALRKARIRPFRRSVFQRRSRYGAHALINDVAAFAQGRYEAVIVFDGAGNISSERPNLPARGVRIEFSPTGVSADTVVQKLCIEAREEGRACSVVSSDGTIQAVVMGKGVTRISSRMLVDEIKQIDNDVHEAEEAPQIKMTLGSRLSPDALAKLKALRGR